MTAYINSLIAVIVACQLVIKLAPDSGTSKKYVRLICSLAVLGTMIAPVKSLVLSADELYGQAAEFFSPPQKEEKSDAFAPAATALLSYIEDTFHPRGEVRLTFITDDDERITEVQIFAPTADGQTCGRIERALGGELSVGVRVFGDGGGGDDGEEQD